MDQVLLGGMWRGMWGQAERERDRDDKEEMREEREDGGGEFNEVDVILQGFTWQSAVLSAAEESDQISGSTTV